MKSSKPDPKSQEPSKPIKSSNKNKKKGPKRNQKTNKISEKNLTLSSSMAATGTLLLTADKPGSSISMKPTAQLASNSTKNGNCFPQLTKERSKLLKST
jgi:hypothetical protein